MVEIELLGILLVQVSHQDLQCFVTLALLSSADSVLERAREVDLSGFSLMGGGRRRRQGGERLGDVQVPMFTVHLANHIGTPAQEELVHGSDFISPATVRPALAFGKEEVLTAVKDTVRSSCRGNTADQWRAGLGETSIKSSNFENARKSMQKGSGATGLEDQLVREDEHAGFGQEVGIDVIRLDNGENLAVDEVEHAFPGVRRHGLESIWNRRVDEVIGRRSEPHLKKLFGPCSGS